MGMAAGTAYPIRVEADYAERQSRWKALLRLPLGLPVLIFSYLLEGTVAVAMWAAVLVSGRIPRWLFDFQVAANCWWFRAASYCLLLTDVYPPFEGDYPIRYGVEYPERVSRWKLVVWKFITAISHFFVLAVLTLVMLVAVAISWFAILVTGRFPQRLHRYVAGVLRWQARVGAYVLSLTDEFPPFSLSADAGPGGPNSYAISSALGALAIAGVIGGITTLAILRPGDIVSDISYERLLAGDINPGETRVQVNSAEDQFESEAQTGAVELTAAADPADDLVPLLVPQRGYRFVEFELVMENESYQALESDQSSFRLKDEDGATHRSVLAVVDGRVHRDHRPEPWADREALWEVDEGEAAKAFAFFELPIGVDPLEFRFNMGHHVHRAVIYEFR